MEEAVPDPRLLGKTVHSAYRYESIVAILDPGLIRAEARRKEGLFQVDGFRLDPIEKTIANGRRLVERRASITVEAIREARRRDP